MMFSWRLGKVALVVFALMAVTFSGGGFIFANHTRGGDLLPDLVTVAPREMEVKYVGGQKRLYFTNEIINQHTGVLEIVTSSTSCNSGNGRIVSQRIFQDANNDGAFVRGVDNGSRTVQVGCMVFHPAHNHWHFDDFTQYRLVNLSGGTISEGFKQSTCIEDSAPRYNLPGQPNSKYYGECTSTRPQGLSVGWGDIYRSTLPDQYVSIAGVPNGEYCLLSIVNPDRNMLEVNHYNNSAALRLIINGNSVTASSNTSCPSNNPAPIPASLSVYDDSLHWDNWSWGTSINTANTSPIYSGSRSMAVTYNNAWAGLSFHSSGLNTSSLSHLHFAIAMGGRPLSNISVTLYGSADNPLTTLDPTDYATGGAHDWFTVSIPLSDLGAANSTVSRVAIQDNTGTTQPTFYVDELGFLSETNPGGDPPPPPPPSSSAVIYDNALHWDDWSWSTSVNPGASSPVVSSPNSMSVQYNAGYAGLSLHHPGFSTSSYTHLRFSINMAGQSLSGLQVSLYNTSGGLIRQVNPANHATSSGGWFTVNIPLSELGGSNTTITRVQIQNATSSARPAFYIDDMSFGGGSTPPPPPPPGGSSSTIYGDSLTWANWSWSASVNPNATSPVFAGSNSMAVTYNSAWAGLSLHHSGFSTSPYTHLRFAIHLGGRPVSSVVVSLYNASDSPFNDIDPTSYATSAGGGWMQVAIPLSALGASSTTVTRVTIQDNTGGPQPTFHIDNLAFTN
jgi:hypothetical protein